MSNMQMTSRKLLPLLKKIIKKEEIQKIKRYKKQWKIKTNLNKLPIIKTNRQKKGVIWIRGQREHYNSEGTILELGLNTLWFAKHVDYQNNLARKLQTLYSLRNLTIANKKIYLDCIRQALLYTIAPTHNLSKVKLQNFKRNKIVYFIIHRCKEIQ